MNTNCLGLTPYSKCMALQRHGEVTSGRLMLASRVSHSDVLKSLDSLAQLMFHSLDFWLRRKHTYSPLQFQIQNELFPPYPFLGQPSALPPQSPNPPSVPMGGGDKQGGLVDANLGPIQQKERSTEPLPPSDPPPSLS